MTVVIEFTATEFGWIWLLLKPVYSGVIPPPSATHTQFLVFNLVRQLLAASRFDWSNRQFFGKTIFVWAPLPSSSHSWILEIGGLMYCCCPCCADITAAKSTVTVSTLRQAPSLVLSIDSINALAVHLRLSLLLSALFDLCQLLSCCCCCFAIANSIATVCTDTAPPLLCQ